MTSPDICLQIVDHMAAKNNRQDTLEGILLGIYEQKLNRITKETTKTLGEMVRARIIVQEQEIDESVVYRLRIRPEDVSLYLEESSQ